MESISLQMEAKRCHWRAEILSGKHGENAKKRLITSIMVGLHERHCI